MQPKTVWCVGILLTCATLFSPQPSLSAPTPEPVPESQPITQPLRLEIRLKQRRVNVYQGDRKVKSYAIAVGKPGWETPIGNYTIKQKIRNPEWIHPLNGEKVPGGDPENPLGRYWIGFWTDGKNWIGFHGTPNPESVGTAASHGCIRMYNRDVEELFGKVSLGTEVVVKN
ncbi:MAG: L,D-transpeptidase [Phormidium tanganyikae FI6-MK23]|jgi:lipoprotein-anchoring transpeptidase ErfK/SrfK|nr:L,D-transpeptidase [Phormidium tanganyikae FI6-MK23]